MVTKERETEKAIIQVGAEERKLTITFNDVKKYLCPKASDAEIGLFLKVCASEQLNPFAREVYLVKYTEDQPAAIIIATETFVKAAETCPEYDGAEAGIILKDTAGKLEFREGSFLLDDEAKNLAGGWAKVYRKDRTKPTYAAVNIRECMKYTRSGKPTRFWEDMFWEDMPATMVRKVALSRALREAFPNRFGGTLTTAEFEEMPEGQLPPAFERDGKPHWKKLWPRVKSELGLTEEEARQLLGVKSINEELINQGWTPGQVWDELVKRLKEQQSPSTEDLKQIREKVDEAITQREVKHEEIVDVQTGEIITQDEELFGEEETREAPSKPQRDPETIKDINQLLKACHDDFKLQPKQVYAELNVSGAMGIADPVEAYRTIAAVRQ